MQAHRDLEGALSPAGAPFLPAARAEEDELQAAIDTVNGSPVVQAMLDAFNAMVFVLNPQRQIVAASSASVLALPQDSAAQLIGLRPGEATDCMRVKESDGGCGTADACSECGVAQAIRDSQKQEQASENECLLTTEQGMAYAFDVLATPIRLGEQPFTVLCLNDVSGEKKRQMLERTFFHDILNSACGLHGWAEILPDEGPTEMHQTAKRIHDISAGLISEIRSQQALVDAEGDTLGVHTGSIVAQDLLNGLDRTFALHDCAEGRTLRITPPSEPIDLETDSTLALRVLTNMVKNAMEAIPRGEGVEVSITASPTTCTFIVWNGGFIEPSVAKQIFQKYFTTKNVAGRGLGTYSMKLFGEKYLGGQVSFTTDPASGTTFYFALPIA